MAPAEVLSCGQPLANMPLKQHIRLGNVYDGGIVISTVILLFGQHACFIHWLAKRLGVFCAMRERVTFIFRQKMARAVGVAMYGTARNSCAGA